ncbi:MAG: aldehyde dehydrogenase family protein, partial [Planctomycetota bacterium]
MAELDPDLAALQEVRDAVARAKQALAAVARYRQDQIDRLCEAVVQDAAAAAGELSRLAVEETGIGKFHYKVLKTLFGCEAIWAAIQDEKTVGIVSRDETKGVIEIATPVGIVAAVIPTTNPTSTALHNGLISLKGRNAVVMSPHPRARRTVGRTAEVMRRAIARAGGPPDLVQSLSNPTIESTGALMKHRDVSVILATGGTGLVKAAYSSGKPSYGVGPGNVPVYVDRSADVEEAARWIVASQSFDNGTFCCSEQGLVVDRAIADRLFAAFAARGAHLCREEEVRLLEKGVVAGGHMRPEIVGLDPCRVAEMCGFRVPPHTTLLLAPQGGVGKDWPLSCEILCPLLSVHLVDGWEEGCEVSLAILHAEGLGHTVGIWARDPVVLDAWFLEKPANRIVVNGPTSEGAVGYSTNLEPSVSLGCGPQAGNITSDNISARHLVNIKRIAFTRRDWEERYARDHARAAAISGEAAPRGSGLPGDPGLVGRGAPAAPAAGSVESNWRGNPPSELPAGPSPAAAAPRPAPAPPPAP